MKNLCFLLLSAFIIFLCSCSGHRVTEKIEIATTSGSIETDYEKINVAVRKIDRSRIQQEILAEYPNVDRHWVESVKVASVKETTTLGKQVGNVKTKSETCRLFVEVSMDYDVAMEEQAILLVKDYKALVSDELEKNNIGVDKF